MSEATTDEAYMGDIAAFRAEKDHFFRTDPASPIETKGFTGLCYYPVSAAWRVTARLELFDTQDVVMLTTSVGDTQPYRRIGRAHFDAEGQACALTLYRPTFETANAHLFIPFRDATSGSETYGAGRYRCPLPPAENRLEVAIRAGEKL